MRQQLQSVNAQIEQLRELTKTMALELRDDRDEREKAPASVAPIAPRLYVVSDDSESEDDTDDESESDDEPDIKVEEIQKNETKVIKVEPRVEPKVEPKAEAVEPIVEAVEAKEEIDFQVEELELLDLEAKVVNVDMSAKLDKYSLKELKEMVVAKGGPAALKTKKAMIEFLEKLK
jgi:hypothetical protein